MTTETPVNTTPFSEFELAELLHQWHGGVVSVAGDTIDRLVYQLRQSLRPPEPLTNIRSRREIEEMLVILKEFGSPEAVKALQWVLACSPNINLTTGGAT